MNDTDYLLMRLRTLAEQAREDPFIHSRNYLLQFAVEKALQLDRRLSEGAPLPKDWDKPIKRCSETFCGSTNAPYYDEVADEYFCAGHSGPLSGHLLEVES